MVTKTVARKIVKRLGKPKAIYVGLQEFSNRVRTMEAKRADLTKQYPNKWVAMYDGDIVVVADTLEKVLEEMDQKHIPRKGTVIEYMETERRNLVL